MYRKSFLIVLVFFSSLKYNGYSTVSRAVVCFMSFRHGGLPPNLYGKEVPAMSDFEILSTVIGIIGLLIALYAAVKEKNNR